MDYAVTDTCPPQVHLPLERTVSRILFLCRYYFHMHVYEHVQGLEVQRPPFKRQVFLIENNTKDVQAAHSKSILIKYCFLKQIMQALLH